MMNTQYYRPEWTCGRYDSEAQIAIMYNLIEGMSYFFEEDSAKVIGALLSIPRNGQLSIQDIVLKTNISEESLSPFFEELEEYGLCIQTYPTSQIIKAYRRKVFEQRCFQSQNEVRNTKEKLPFDISGAEMDYMNRSNGITSVMFELTYNCSEKCIHCYNPGATRNDKEISKRSDRQELTLGDYKRIIDELYEKGLIRVCLSGGDPFSKSIVWEIVDYLYNKEIAFDIYTNGQRILQDTERIANYYPRLVAISIYSGIPEDHDYITRIKGSWDKSMYVLKQLASFAVPLNLKCCVMRSNIKSYYLVKDIAKRYGAVPQFEINITDSIEGDKCASKHLRLTPDLLEVVLRDDDVPLYVGAEAPNFGGQSKDMEKNACGAGYNSFCVSPEGFLMPCCAFHTVFGDLKKESVRHILDESKELRWWQSLTLKQYEDCGKHSYCDYCNLCPGNNFSEWGTPLKAGENNCYIAQNRYSLAQKMKEFSYDPLQNMSLTERLKSLSHEKRDELKREVAHNYINQRLKVGG